MRYSRNRIYISEENQEKIKNFPILLGGVGIGSIIAECALRLGFEKITLIDGDEVELSNLNRQNYTKDDIGISKVEALKKRLLSINPDASIECHHCFLTPENVDDFTSNHAVAINALDFTSEVPLLFDESCNKKGIPILHPYNLGWGGLVTVINSETPSLTAIARPNQKFTELNMVEYVTNYLKFWGNPEKWIDDTIEEYKNETEDLSPPQLSVASWIVAGMCTNLLFKIAIGKEIKVFPEFYLSTINQ
jgi:molybdopterin/thiamine biosynthesis adenylyltransferase